MLSTVSNREYVFILAVMYEMGNVRTRNVIKSS